MSTQTKSRRAPPSSSSMSVVKVSRSALRCEQVLEAGLVDRDLAAGERVDLLLDDVAGDHRVAELGEAGGGDEADPADPDDADGSFCSLIRCSFPSSSAFSSGRSPSPSAPSRSSGRWSSVSQEVIRDPVGVLPALPGDHLDIFAVDVDVVFAPVDRLRSGSGRRGSAGPTSRGSPARRSNGCRRRASSVDDHPVGDVAVARPRP